MEVTAILKNDLSKKDIYEFILRPKKITYHMHAGIFPKVNYINTNF